MWNNAGTTFRACVKRAFGQRMGEMLISPQEEKLYEEFYTRWREYAGDPQLGGYPQFPPKISRTGLRKLLREKLAGQGFGKFDGWDFPTEWRYRLPVGPWTVETYVDTGGSSRQLEFKHNIVKDPEGVPLLDSGVIPLLGLLFPIWNRLTPEDLPEAADDLTVLIRHFLNVVPSLLKGIKPTRQ